MNKIKRTKRVVPPNAQPGLDSLRQKGYIIRDCYHHETRADGKHIYVVLYEKIVEKEEVN